MCGKNNISITKLRKDVKALKKEYAPLYAKYTDIAWNNLSYTRRIRHKRTYMESFGTVAKTILHLCAYPGCEVALSCGKSEILQ